MIERNIRYCKLHQVRSYTPFPTGSPVLKATLMFFCGKCINDAPPNHFLPRTQEVN